jgi:hypothetical protein
MHEPCGKRRTNHRESPGDDFALFSLHGFSLEIEALQMCRKRVSGALRQSCTIRAGIFKYMNLLIYFSLTVW